MNITEALSELKVLANRINKETNNGQFINSNKVNNAPVGFSSVVAFTDKAKASFQSIIGLIARRNQIKAAIVKSNALTNLTIAGKTYTVAEAIERKNSIQYERTLLGQITNQHRTTTALIEKQTQLLQSKLDSLIETTLGKEKSDPNTMKQITDNFWAINKVECIDPLNLMEKIESLQNEIESFLASVDVALTVSNSTTDITV